MTMLTGNNDRDYSQGMASKFKCTTQNVRI